MKKLDLIFDTDVGSDCDDMMALAYLVYAGRYRKVRLKAVTHCYDCLHGIPAIRAFFRDLGEEAPPMGKMPCEPVVHNNYSRAVAERFAVEAEYAPVPDAVSVLRRALAESEDAVICAVGPFTNIAALLESKGDAISPLDGVALVKEKCAKMVLMAGHFVPGKGPEWNAKVDAPATRKVTELCPVPLIFLPGETGTNMITGKPVMEKYGEGNPLSLAFMAYTPARENGGRHSWDPAAAVYAVEGCREFFAESPWGTITVDEAGRTTHVADGKGRHCYLTMKRRDGFTEQQCKDLAAEYINSCALKIYE